jgi:hypothetical protein
MKISELIPVFVDIIPDVFEEGKLYISEKYTISVHLCACGCKQKTFLSFPHVIEGIDRGWTHKNNNGLITIRPSIGNFMGENPYHAHYHITNNKIEWI